MIISNLNLVEAAGVEPDISVENTQLTDSGNASFAGNAMISKSTVQTLYKLFLEFPERQSSAFPSWRRRRILKRSWNSYTSADADQELNCVCMPAILIRKFWMCRGGSLLTSMQVLNACLPVLLHGGQGTVNKRELRRQINLAADRRSGSLPN
jgi:hypothetical protein